MLHLYSDASYVDGMAVASCMILDTDGNFLTFFPRVYYNIKTSVQSEILGIIQGLEWVLEHCEGEEVTIYCDNLSIGERLALYPDTHYIPNDCHALLWFRVFSLLDKIGGHVMYHISAHQTEHNPNKACDMLCRRVCKYITRGETHCTP